MREDEDGVGVGDGADADADAREHEDSNNALTTRLLPAFRSPKINPALNGTTTLSLTVLMNTISSSENTIDEPGITIVLSHKIVFSSFCTRDSNARIQFSMRLKLSWDPVFAAVVDASELDPGIAFKLSASARFRFLVVIS